MTDFKEQHTLVCSIYDAVNSGDVGLSKNLRTLLITSEIAHLNNLGHISKSDIPSREELELEVDAQLLSNYIESCECWMDFEENKLKEVDVAIREEILRRI